MKLNLRGGRARVYRSRDARNATIVGVIMATGFILVAIIIDGGGVAAYVCAGFLVLLAWRTWRIGIHVEPGGVVVASWLRTRRIASTDIERFSVRPLGSFKNVAHVDLRSGRNVPILGLIGGGSGGRAARAVQQHVDELNATASHQTAARA